MFHYLGSCCRCYFYIPTSAAALHFKEPKVFLGFIAKHEAPVPSSPLFVSHSFI